MLYALSTVWKSTTLDDLEGHYCVFDVVTISTEVYLCMYYTYRYVLYFVMTFVFVGYEQLQRINVL